MHPLLMHGSECTNGRQLCSWQYRQRPHVCLQSWILWRQPEHDVLSMQGMLTERHESQPLPRQHKCRHVNMLV